MASFLHDIALDDIDLPKIKIIEEEIKQRGNDVFRFPELLKYINHPQQAAELFNKIEEPIPDVSIILAQHHELPDGTGFPHKLNALMISPLAAVLIVAHHLVDAYFEAGKDLDLAGHINTIPQSFHRGNFRAVLHAMTDLAIDV